MSICIFLTSINMNQHIPCEPQEIWWTMDPAVRLEQDLEAVSHWINVQNMVQLEP